MWAGVTMRAGMVRASSGVGRCGSGFLPWGVGVGRQLSTTSVPASTSVSGTVFMVLGASSAWCCVSMQQLAAKGTSPVSP